MRFRVPAAWLVVSVCLAGCDLAPHYVPPSLQIPAGYRGTQAWPAARPADTLPRGQWWRMFQNPTIDALEPSVAADNPNLAATVQVLEQARDLTVQAGYGLFPTLTTGASFTENRQSAHRPLRGPNQPNEYGANTIDAAATWEIDLWEAIANAVRAQKRSAQADAADVASLRLSLEAELANDIITLRGLDQEAAIYRAAIEYYETGVRITRQRLGAKIGSALEVDQAENQLSAAQAQYSALHGRRDLLEHAIASLIGRPANNFSLPPQQDMKLVVPGISGGVASLLLQRRPDIAAAERRMAAANAQIGVARAAFYPNVTLSAQAGFQDTGLALASLPNALWSVGTAIALPLFEGGLRRAVLAAAHAAYEQTRDDYRAVVLGGVQDVEDQLSLLHWLGEQDRQQTEAMRSALAAQALAMQLYQAGADSYLQVVIQEGNALSAQIATASVTADEASAAVDLIRALGGGWQNSVLPDSNSIVPFSVLP